MRYFLIIMAFMTLGTASILSDEEKKESVPAPASKTEKTKPVKSEADNPFNALELIYKKAVDQKATENQKRFSIPFILQWEKSDVSAKFLMPFLITGTGYDSRELYEETLILTPAIGYVDKTISKNYNVAGKIRLFFSPLALTGYVTADEKDASRHINNDLSKSGNEENINNNSIDVFVSFPLLSVWCAEKSSDKENNLVKSENVFASFPLLTLWSDTATKVKTEKLFISAPLLSMWRSTTTENKSETETDNFFMSLPLLTGFSNSKSSEKDGTVLKTKKSFILGPLLAYGSETTEAVKENKKDEEVDIYILFSLLFKQATNSERDSASSLYGFAYAYDKIKDKDSFDIGPEGIFWKSLATPNNVEASILFGLLYKYDLFSRKKESESGSEAAIESSEHSECFYGAIYNCFKDKDEEKYSFFLNFYGTHETEKTLSRNITPFFGYSVDKKKNECSALSLRFFNYVSFDLDL